MWGTALHDCRVCAMCVSEGFVLWSIMQVWIGCQWVANMIRNVVLCVGCERQWAGLMTVLVM